MRNIELSSLNIGDIVSHYHLRGTLVWKSYMEYPLNRLYGDPIAYIYSDKVDTYPPETREKAKFYYLFHLILETKKYELVAKGADFRELNKTGDELQEAFREKYVVKRDDFSEWNN